MPMICQEAHCSGCGEKLNIEDFGKKACPYCGYEFSKDWEILRKAAEKRFDQMEKDYQNNQKYIKSKKPGEGPIFGVSVA
jgi:hypothetical protein